MIFNGDKKAVPMTKNNWRCVFAGVVGGSTQSLESDDSTMSGDACSALSQETAIARGPGSLGRQVKPPLILPAIQISEFAH
jgi:hypothetical protein